MRSGLSASVLTLNRLYAAVHVVSARRAFGLLCKGLAEVVNVEDGSYLAYGFESWLEDSELRDALEARNPDDDWIATVNFQVRVPRVIRLLHYDRLPRQTVKFSRRNIFLRDENRCQYCLQRFHTQQLSLDHVIPRSRGGETNWENIVSACQRCNTRKGSRTPQEAGMPLERRPAKPLRNPALSHQLNSRKYACWSKFLE
jgi:5-methylcytosine-specific restriction endonuclease McrA